MLDIKVLRERPEAAKAGAVKKHMPDRAHAVDRALAIDAELRAMTPRLDAMRSEQKAGGKQLGKLSPEERQAALQALAKLPRNSSPVRLRTRCIVSGRPRAVYKKFMLSRIAFRELAHAGQLPGVHKASW